VVEPGELVTLLGPSGCGKTTTLRMVAGFELPTEGKILIGDTDVTMLPPNKRDTATMFQSYGLFPHMSVFDNVAYGLKLRKRPVEEITKRVNESLALVGLESYGGRAPSKLSGGQQQRVAVARAVIANPKIILADEPTGNLDSAHGDEVMKILTDLNDAGTTILMVTHSPANAELAHRIVHLFDGQVVTEKAGVEFHV